MKKGLFLLFVFILSIGMSYSSVYAKAKTAKDYFTAGVALNNSEKYKDAITNFDKAIKLNPKYAEAYYNKGIALSWLDKIF
jgi:tetratricopeptide (TPR) repeat protein